MSRRCNRRFVPAVAPLEGRRAPAAVLASTYNPPAPTTYDAPSMPADLGTDAPAPAGSFWAGLVAGAVTGAAVGLGIGP